MDLQILLALGVLSFDALNAHINNLPRISTRLADMGLFQEQGLVGTTIVKVGINGTKLVLVRSWLTSCWVSMTRPTRKATTLPPW